MKNDSFSYTTSDANTSSSNFALRVQIAKHAVCIPKFDNNNGETRNDTRTSRACVNKRKLTDNKESQISKINNSKSLINTTRDTVNGQNQIIQSASADITSFLLPN